MDLNTNIAACIQQANSIGGTTYYNICNGTQHWVPWGAGDWVAVLSVGLIALGIVGLVIGMVRS